MVDNPSRNLRFEVDIAGLVNALGSHLLPERERLVQELLQNAMDAIVVRAAKDRDFTLQDGRITVRADSGSSTFEIGDNGIGIAPEQLELAFSLLAASKVRELTEAAYTEAPNVADMIGRFGTGLLSTFVLSDHIEITSRPFGGATPFRVSLDNRGQWSVADAARDECGTTVALTVNQEGRFLTERSVVEQLVLRYCRLVPVPIYFDQEHVPVWPGRRSRPKALNAPDLVNATAEVLVRENLAYQAQPAIGGLRPDFIVYGPNGRTVILEVKSRMPEPGYIARTLRQIEQYRSATGAGAVLVVTADNQAFEHDARIASLVTLPALIRREFDRTNPPATRKRVSFGSRSIFAAMPFSDDYDDTCFVAMVPAAEELGAVCVRVDREEFSGDIVREIQALITESSAVIGDLSEAKPNVLYEVGYAHALNKPVAHISSTGADHLPFDVRNWNTIQYRKGRTHVLREALVKRLKAILK